jgi:ketosteroid isomerase-like protein
VSSNGPKLTRGLIESAFAAWNRGDIDGFLDHATEDIAWVEVAGRPESSSGARHGRDRLRRGLRELFDAWESYRLDVERIEVAGDRALALVREVGRGRSSGLEIDSRWGYIVTVADGKLARVEAYRDPDAALAAWAGITHQPRGS